MPSSGGSSRWPPSGCGSRLCGESGGPCLLLLDHPVLGHERAERDDPACGDHKDLEDRPVPRDAEDQHDHDVGRKEQHSVGHADDGVDLRDVCEVLQWQADEDEDEQQGSRDPREQSIQRDHEREPLRMGDSCTSCRPVRRVSGRQPVSQAASTTGSRGAAKSMASGKGTAKNTSPKPRGEQSRTERVIALRAEERKRERRQFALIAGVGVLLVALIAGAVVLFYANRPKPPDYSQVPNTAPSGVSDIYNANAKDASGAKDQWGGISHNHVDGTVNYPLSPPDGGDHNPYPQTCGVYGKAIKNENAVHSMEHGAVWIAYKPDISGSQLSKIKADVKNLSFTLVSPYPGLTSNVVASAWGVQLKLDSADDPRLQQFIKFYRLNPDRTPELGAACTGVG